MSRTRRTYRRNSSEAAARVIAALLAHDGRLDWRELEFLDGTGTLQILGIERERFMAVLSRSLGERLGSIPKALPMEERMKKSLSALLAVTAAA